MNRTLLRFSLVAMLALGTVLATTAALPREAQAASPALDDAQRLYDSAKFDDAITRLRDALASGQVAGPDALKAKELLGRSLVKAGNRVEAREAFKSLLRTDSGYRLDAVSVPPDEVEVFNLALKDIQSEQIEAGNRIPASISLFYGVGSGDNKSMGEIVKAGGGDDKFDSKPEFGGSVRFPLRPRFSLDVELSRFRATDHDSVSGTGRTEFEASAIPLVVSLYWTAVPGNKYRVNLFGGAGPMLASRAGIEFLFFTIHLGLADEKVGTYVHGGVEGEYMVTPKLSISGRVLGRYANASKLFKNSDLMLYGPPAVPLANRKVDFSGFGAYIGLRGYIGY